MSQIIHKVRNVDPNNSDEVKSALTTFFQNLAKHTEVDSNNWLRVLENTITRFPRYCNSHKSTIETYLIHFIDSANYYNVIEAAKCGHALQQVRSSQDKAVTAKTNWRDQMTALCNAAHDLIDAIFTNSVDIYKTSRKETPLLNNSPLQTMLCSINTISNKQSNTLNKKSLLCTRLRNVFVFIQAMLVEIYPVGKPVRPQSILDVIVRTLSISSGQMSSNIDDVVAIKIQALRTLDALVVCLGSNLIPFSPLLFRFGMQTLKWCSENPSDGSSKVKCAAYATLRSWLLGLRSDRGGSERARAWQHDLATHIARDIAPTQAPITLTMGTQPTRHMSKKAKRKLANTMLKESSIASHIPGEKNKILISEELSDDVAIAALECAEVFLTVCGIFLKPNTHKVLQERIVRECFAIERLSCSRGVALLRALEGLRRSPPASVPPPTQYCLHLYTTLVNSAYAEISKFCCQALLDIRLHLHCSPPSLNFALEPEVVQKKSLEENRKRVSERNREALEALLGAERVPQEYTEDVITIQDEPSTKKSRTEDIDDRISVSSDPVVITDDSDTECSVVQNVEAVIETVQETPIAETNDKNQEVVKESTENRNSIDREEIQNIDSKPVDVDSNIHEATTQLPINNSIETNDEEERPLSMEVSYDYPNTGTEKVKVIEKIEDDNLPSTNDTDDVQITCGQTVVNSQDQIDEVDTEDNDVPKQNGIDISPERVIENGVTDINCVAEKGISINDMLADFVDEVIEEDNA